MEIFVQNIFCGKEKRINNKFDSAYEKELLHHDVYEINKMGFVLDSQSDKNVHGGVDKAICVYCLNEYEYLQKKYKLLLPLCAFGENLCLEGISDKDICLADQFKYGETILEVSQPRRPCWKISAVLGIKNFTSTVVKEYKTGFYFRVIKEGKITPLDKLELISRPYPKYTIEYLNKIFFNAKDYQKEIKEVLQCEKLANAFNLSLTKRYINKDNTLDTWQVDAF